MSDSTKNLRLGALAIGEKTAQIVVFVCSIAVVGILIVSPSDSSSSLPTATSVPVQILIGSTKTPDSTAAPQATAVSTPQAAAETTLQATATSTPQATATSTPSLPTFTSVPSVPKVGIVAGHWWLDESGQQSLDVGGVCDEGSPNELTELEINLGIAHRVVFELLRIGYRVDLLQEWDDQLDGYQADVLVSIHADACLYPEASGFKVARVTDSHVPEIEDRLVDCLVEHYGARTGLAFHEGSITADMTQYHTFYEIDPETPGAIIEVGFMLADRRLLTQRQDLVAQGIIDGILCFLEGEGRTLE
jgi:N-acetylmuramoyl-L-alanine amidase